MHRILAANTRPGTRRLSTALVLCLSAGCGAGDSDRPAAGRSYRPSDQLARLSTVAVDGDDIGVVRDFDMAGDSVYLLDAGGRVVIMERNGGSLRVAGHFGRSGGGPGEFLRPTGMALIGTDIVVADGTRLQFFSRAGGFVTAKTMTLPCPMVLPFVAPARGGLFVHGACLRRGYVTDTMKAVLAWSADTAGWQVLVETPRFTTDGRMGSVFGASSLLTTGLHGIHAFGGGERNCIWHIDDGSDPPVANEMCPAVSDLYRADPPPGLEARMRSPRFAGMNLRWPESLPAYGDRFVIEDDVILLRPFTADSVVLQLAGAAAVDIAVAPFDGLVGCKAAGCLWLVDTSDTPHVIVLDRAMIEAMAERALAK